MSPIRTLVIAFTLVGCSKAPAPPPAEKALAAPAAEQPTVEQPTPAEAKAAFEARAKAATGALKTSLVGALQSAMKDGTAAAVQACNTRAPEITSAAAEAGLRVGRTSARLRNPSNAPATWLEPLLATYAALPADQAKPRVIEIDGGELAYVEPLYAGGLCLTCHGQTAQIPADVKARLATLYPNDQATGYAPGEFRGLVWARSR